MINLQAFRERDCISLAELMGTWPTIEVAVSGGSGRYAGASGSGVMQVRDKVICCETGRAIWTWTGTLNVAGLTSTRHHRRSPARRRRS